MSKTTGLGELFYVGAFDLSGDVGALSTIAASRGQQDVTAIRDLAHARLGLLRDGHLAYTAFFDPDTGQEHLALRNLPQSGLVTWASGTVVGAACASLVANHTDYPLVRGADGSLVASPTADANGYGMQWGVLLTAGGQTFASAAAGSYVDDYFPSFGGASAPPTLFGLAAYLHVLSIGSGSATVHVQDSSDHVSFADVTGAVFSAASGATSQRVATSATQAVNRYLRLNVTGTFVNLTAVVSVVRYINQFVA